MTWGATYQATMEVSYLCEHCNYTTTAFVAARGSATGPSREQAHAGSMDDALREAGDTLMYVPCPKCGRTDDYGGRYKTGVAVNAVLLVLGTMLLGLVMVWMKGFEVGEMALWIAAIFGLIIGAVYYFKRRRAWASAIERTRFVTDSQPPG